MRLTSFTDYGLRMLMRMAAEPARAFSPAGFAEEFGLSRNHLAKIMQKLAAGGIVETRRGAGGGAVLARPAGQIRLGVVVRLLEEDQPLVECFATVGAPCTITPFSLNRRSEPMLTPADFRGRVLAVEVFQMLCPGCVMHGLPQAQRIAATFDTEDVAVIGLHSVFEHHTGNSRGGSAAFLHEWRIRFPVAIDAPGDDPLPRTMAAWGLQGTPTLVLIDRQGRMRARHFGQVSDLALGAEIMGLVQEPAA